ncbi:MAG: hypothetical protein ABI852_03920 [Gemmatimonadaceae bacterium]
MPGRKDKPVLKKAEDKKPVLKKADEKPIASKADAAKPTLKRNSDDAKPVVVKKADDRKPVIKKSGDTKPSSSKKGDFTATPKADAGNDWGSMAESAGEWRDARQRTVLRINVRRPDDMFVADIWLYNLKIVSGAKPTLARIDAGEIATLVIELPPQSFGEEALLEATGPEVQKKDEDEFENPADPNSEFPNNNTAVKPEDEEPVPPLSNIRIRMSGPSRLSFKMPTGTTSIPYTLDALLNAARTWPMRRALGAAIEPEPIDTSNNTITIPAGVVLRSMVDSEDFADEVNSVKRSLQELKTDSPSDARIRPLTDLVAQYDSIADKAKLGKAGGVGLSESTAPPLLQQLAKPQRPTSKVTSLELPYRLLTSPINAAHWAHRTSAILQHGRSELWHTRLTNNTSNFGPDAPTKMRAIWSDDYPLQSFANTINNPFRMPLDAQDRQMLVNLTAGYGTHQKTGADYMPRAVKTSRVILSALGGLFDSEGAWSSRPEHVDIEQWRHMMSLGRDHYVRVVYAGFLLPFGHAASLIKVTERKFEPSNKNLKLGKRVAVLRQRFFIVVREPVKVFDGSYHIHGGHGFPFTSVELLTRVTPNLVSPDDPACLANSTGRMLYDDGTVIGGLTPRQLFWPMMRASAEGDFKFDVAATDRDGRRVTFSMPLLFMSEVGNTSSVKKKNTAAVGMLQIANIIGAYNDADNSRRLVSMSGANICFAPPDANAPGDPRIPTHDIKFRAGPVSQRSDARINTYPEAEEARVTLLAAQQILGRSINPVRVQYTQEYRNVGFSGSNTGEVYLELKDGPFDMSFGGTSQASRTDVVGGVASPTNSIEGFSRRIGLAPNLIEVAKNSFDPHHFFGDAKILGSIILANLVPKTSLTGDGAPKFVTRDLPASGNLPARAEARYDWVTHIAHSDPDKLLVPSADQSKQSPFTMQAIVTTPVGDPGSATTIATATIGNFKVDLFGFIVLWFRSLEFTTEKGHKPKVSVDLHPTQGVAFGGPLEFVNQLKDLLPGNGFSDPSALSVTASGIEAKYSLSIPSVQVGIFALSGLSIGARFSLPFDVKPVEVGFNFGERENPFSLTVSLLGGGGFLSIGIGADGVHEIEAALEAGARLAIDLGVASGSVEIKAGIYFHWLAASDANDGLVQLTGYVRVHGELDVMSIISISITFNLSLTYEKEGKRSLIWGEASVTVEIEVLVFSGEVTVRCRREFAGSDADPTFVQLMPADTTWSSYCSAFAEA